jgi:hypothetical protein
MTTTKYVKPFSSSGVPILNACATNFGDWSFMISSVAEAHESESYLANEPSPTNIHACALARHLKLLIVTTFDPCLKQSIPGKSCSDAWTFLNEINNAELPSTIDSMMIIPPLLSCANHRVHNQAPSKTLSAHRLRCDALPLVNSCLHDCAPSWTSPRRCPGSVYTTILAKNENSVKPRRRRPHQGY